LTKVIWSPSAINDLLTIRRYVAQFNPRAARGMAERILEAGNGLNIFPQRGRPVGNNLHEWTLVYPYIIRYEVVGDEVHVLGVRHGHRRPPV
jgi:toxin ParE1/3/4